MQAPGEIVAMGGLTAYAGEAGARAGGDRRYVRERTALTAAIEVAGPDDPPERPRLRLRITRPDSDLGVVRSAWHLLRPYAAASEENPVAKLHAAYDVWRAAHPPRQYCESGKPAP